jgi:hypothetical protein
VNPDAKGKIKNIVWKEALLDQKEDEQDENVVETKMEDFYGELTGKVVEIESEGVNRYWFSDENMEVDEKTQKLGCDPNENGLEAAELFGELDVEMETEDLFGGSESVVEMETEELYYEPPETVIEMETENLFSGLENIVEMETEQLPYGPLENGLEAEDLLRIRK